MKLAFVVQRYGAEIAGGSEGHCRQLALRLAERHDLTVLTTCARDYVTWANALPAGASMDGGVPVLRFPVAQQREIAAFGGISEEVFDGGAPAERQDGWFSANGPDAPGLLDHLRNYGGDYDLALFWTYRYAPSYFGLPLVADRAVLVPTAEEDPAIDLEVLADFFAKPAGFIFLTPEERTLVANRMRTPMPPSTVVGIGIDPSDIRPEPEVSGDYALYLGRVDRNKGCDTLLDYFQAYAETHPGVTLVLAGPMELEVPAHPRIRSLGYVSDDVRRSLLAHAAVLVVPSPYESLSIALLEGWNAGIPALVNGRCRVLAGQVRRADGGLTFASPEEFTEALDYLLSHPVERRLLGAQGRAYVDREYRWPQVIERVEALLREVSASRSAPGGFKALSR